MHTGTSGTNTLSNPSPIAGTSLLFWAFLTLAFSFLIYVFYDGLELMVRWWEREEYSHGYMIPMVALFMAWQKVNRLPTEINSGSWSGVLLLAIGLVIFLMGELGSLYIIIQYGFLWSLYALMVAALGWRGTMIIWGALAYLIFMIPLPNFLYNNLSSQLQLISSQIGVLVVRAFDISVYLEGNVIDLGSYKLQVVEACSGLRYLFPLMSFGFLVAYLYQGKIWQRVILFLSTIPITVLMNSFRIGVIGVMVEYRGIEMAEGFLHYFEGWIVFMGCLGVLCLELALFHKLTTGSWVFYESIDLSGPENSVRLRDFNPTTGLPGPLLASVVLLLLAAVGLHLLGERSDINPERKSFTQFPLYSSGWLGREQAIDVDVLEELKLTDYLQANFFKRGNRIPVNFYVAYYNSQRKGASIHSPKSCLPGDGWRLTGVSKKKIPGVNNSEGEPLLVNRALMQKGDAAQIVYYWFEQRGRNLTSEYAAKWYMFVDALLDNRTDGALLRVVVPVPDMAEIEKSEQVADQFIQDFYQMMPDYIPGFIDQSAFVSRGAPE